MKRFRQILVVLTDSAADRAALEWGRTVARAAKAERVQVLVLDPTPADGLPEFPRSEEYEPWKERDHEIAELISEVFGESPDFQLHVETSVGSVLPTILHQAVDRGSDLIVVGVADESERRLAEKLARKSPASILSVPEGAGTECNRLLTPVDFSRPSALALEFTGAFARAFGATVRALYAYRVPSRALRTHVAEETLREAHRESATQQLENFLKDNSVPGVSAEPIVRHAELASTGVLQELEEQPYDLVVMSTRGGTSIARALLGSNTAEIIRRAPVPVLAVKAKGEGLSLLRSLLGLQASPTPELASAT